MKRKEEGGGGEKLKSKNEGKSRRGAAEQQQQQLSSFGGVRGMGLRTRSVRGSGSCCDCWDKLGWSGFSLTFTPWEAGEAESIEGQDQTPVKLKNSHLRKRRREEKKNWPPLKKINYRGQTKTKKRIQQKFRAGRANFFLSGGPGPGGWWKGKKVWLSAMGESLGTTGGLCLVGPW